MPCAVATEILARVGELHKRGVNLTAPTALAPEEDLYSVGRGRGGRGGRWALGERFGWVLGLWVLAAGMVGQHRADVHSGPALVEDGLQNSIC